MSNEFLLNLPKIMEEAFANTEKGLFAITVRDENKLRELEEFLESHSRMVYCITKQPTADVLDCEPFRAVYRDCRNVLMYLTMHEFPNGRWAG